MLVHTFIIILSNMYNYIILSFIYFVFLFYGEKEQSDFSFPWCINLDLFEESVYQF